MGNCGEKLKSIFGKKDPGLKKIGSPTTCHKCH